jgi:hypothetical protein
VEKKRWLISLAEIIDPWTLYFAITLPARSAFTAPSPIVTAGDALNAGS